MISFNNVIVGAVISVVLFVAMLFSSCRAFAQVRENSIITTELVQHLALDDVESIMEKGPKLVIMWSLDCPACFEELETISLLLARQPNLPIVLISTDDDPSRTEEINQVYADRAFRKLPRWIYSPNQAQLLRYTIDPTWQGELPRSYYIDENGKRHGHSGLLTEQQLMTIVGLMN